MSIEQDSVLLDLWEAAAKAEFGIIIRVNGNRRTAMQILYQVRSRWKDDFDYSHLSIALDPNVEDQIWIHKYATARRKPSTPHFEPPQGGL